MINSAGWVQNDGASIANQAERDQRPASVVGQRLVVPFDGQNLQEERWLAVRLMPLAKQKTPRRPSEPDPDR
ncbi:MAG: hypothetical protein ABIV25_15215 [Paracoccaceae bacterium]